jgi:predicted component of type VI protein secretion system
MVIRAIVNTVLVAALVVVFIGRGSTAAERISEQQAIAEIHKLGGSVTIDERSPDKPVIAVHFRGPQVMDAGLEHLRGLAQLRQLYLGGRDSQITDSGLEHVKGLTQLQTLNKAAVESS